MRLEHVGIAVSNIELALKTFEDLLDTSRYKTEKVSSENVITHFLWAGGVKIELLESTHAESAVSRFLKKRGEGIHHLAFSVHDLDLVRNKMTSLGFHIIGEQSQSGADGKRIFFLHPKDAFGVLIECCATDSASPDSCKLTAVAPNVTLRTFGTDANPGVIIASCHAESNDASQVHGMQLARCLEPVAHVNLVEWMNEDDLTDDVAEGVHQSIGPANSRYLTIGPASCKLVRLFLNLGVRPRSWVRVERSEYSALDPEFPSISGRRLLVAIGKAGDTVMKSKSGAESKSESWPTVSLPAYAVRPDEPGTDALLPLIRSFWQSEQ